MLLISFILSFILLTICYDKHQKAQAAEQAERFKYCWHLRTYWENRS